VPDGVQPWALENFIERFDAWVGLESSSDDLRFVVLEWIFTRRDDPYQGVKWKTGFDNLWFGQVPNSQGGCGHVVTCSYWIQESNRTVRCDNFGTLGLPC
jgi:hypothetical protein